MRTLKYGKILFFLIIFVVILNACSSTPSGISNSEFKEAEKFVNMIDYHFTNMTELNNKDKQYAENYINNLSNIQHNFEGDAEVFYADVNKLYVSYDMSVGFNGLSDDIQKGFIDDYKMFRKILIGKYNISFEDTAK